MTVAEAAPEAPRVLFARQAIADRRGRLAGPEGAALDAAIACERGR